MVAHGDAFWLIFSITGTSACIAHYDDVQCAAIGKALHFISYYLSYILKAGITGFLCVQGTSLVCPLLTVAS